MVMLGPPRGGEGRLDLPGSREGLSSTAPGPPASPGPLFPESPWQHSSCCVCGSHCGHSLQLPSLDKTPLLGGASFISGLLWGHSTLKACTGVLAPLGLVSPWVVASYMCLYMSILTEAMRGPCPWSQWALLRHTLGFRLHAWDGSISSIHPHMLPSICPSIHPWIQFLHPFTVVTPSNLQSSINHPTSFHPSSHPSTHAYIIHPCSFLPSIHLSSIHYPTIYIPASIPSFLPYILFVQLNTLHSISL